MLNNFPATLDDTWCDTLPDKLQQQARQRLESLAEALTGAGISVALTADAREQLLRTVAVSAFVPRQLCRFPELLPELLNPASGLDRDAQLAAVAEACDKLSDDTALGARLRQLRNRAMAGIAWRDINGAPLGQTLDDLSWLADTLITLPLAALHRRLQQELGTPVDHQGQPMDLVVLAMGKLGAGELNFSSDVDLIFTFREEGETRDGARSSANSQYFLRLGQRLIALLNDVTAEGFVFRVDVRLRPFGDSGPLAMSFDALEHYYQTHGRDWERYAMIKARPLSGDEADRRAIGEMLRAFSFRRYLDYGVFKGLREMKQLILQEARRRALEDNIKLGTGGIREIEFIGQAFQMIRGGREARLRVRPILNVLRELETLQLLPAYVVRELTVAYEFLRHSEHRLQELDDRQTHDLPADDAGRTRLAFAMGYSDWPSYANALEHHRQRVRNHFQQVVATPQTEGGDRDDPLPALWHRKLEPEQGQQILSELGFRDSAESLRRLEQLYQSRYRVLSNEGRARMDTLIPFLIRACAPTENPDTNLQRVLDLVAAVARRTVYLALLVENPLALSQLVRLCGASPWIATLLTRHPILLDELLDPRTLYAPPSREALVAELDRRLAQLPEDDLEQQMDTLRQFQQANVLRVAAADLMEAIPLMRVSDHLTWIAEVILEQSLKLAWRDLIARHGRPPQGGEMLDTGFAIIGYGKLGGIELGYGSDLDLVFLYAHGDGDPMTDGAKPLPISMFYTRLAQRIIHLLNTMTPAGVLYEVDTRLRPSGASGLLVSSLDAFLDYQRNKAWTWEHQALVRARVICGDPRLATAFTAGREEILCKNRDLATLRQEVREMREKMRQALSKSSGQGFDLKQDPGGIADIEFIVQYAVLAWGPRHRELTLYTDNIRILEGLSNLGLLPAADTELLARAYRSYRDRGHKLSLQNEPPVIDSDEFSGQIEAVIRIWQGLTGE